jgi:tRNA(Ile)-lysidine synthase
MRAGDRVGVAVSGGADSVALLGLLLDIRADLGVVLSVVHFNHKLRGKESDEDEQFVRELAKAHELDFFCDFGNTLAHAAERKCGIEAAARELRYQFFWKVIEEQKLWRIATAHTLDDQAETVLLRFLRGAGTRGLSGIHPFVGEGIRTEQHSWQGEGFVRPLLDFRRAQLRHYLKRSSQVWREDSSNVDTAFARNKLRQELMPKVREFNPAIEQVLSETAEMARAEEDYWTEQVGKALIEVAPTSPGGRRRSAIDIVAFIAFPLALQRRMVRALGEREGARLEFHHVQQILDLAASPPTRAEKTIELPHGFEACVRERELWFRSRCPNPQEHGYEIPLSVPGEVEVPNAGLVIATRLLPSAGGELLDPDRAGNLRVRNWRPGDRYWPGHTREPKKVKELLQARHVPAQARAHWPVVVGESGGDEQIVWVPGFAFPEQLLLTNAGGPGLMMEHRVRK